MYTFKKEMIQRLIKIIVLASIVSTLSKLLTPCALSIKTVLLIGFISAASYAIIDTVLPSVTKEVCDEQCCKN